MKLLIITQKVDKNDPILGFFHSWIIKFSEHFESIVVICLYRGEYKFPLNVKVLSLGKERGESRLKYIINFYKFILNERNNYDRVFVHMNQEYIILGGFLWKLLNKNIFMWRNHHAGSVVTDFAASFCKKIFCTSRFSYTAKYRKTVLMPVGVDTDLFTVDAPTGRRLLDILSLGRISPSKHLDFLVSAINKINDPNIRVSIYGDPLPLDQVYYEELKKKAGSLIRFQQGIVNAEAPRIYGSHNIFVNLSSSGMYDKTIFEAMASGCLVLVSNDNLIGHIGSDFIFKQGDMDEFIHKLQKLLAYSEDEKLVAQRDLVRFAYTHSLGRLGDRLFQEII